MDLTYNEIIDCLFIGNSKSIYYRSFDMIVNCTMDHEIAFPDSIYNNSNTVYVRIPIKDDPFESNKLLSLIQETNILEQINLYITNKKSVLIHCSMGIQRSCTLVACYLIYYYKMTPEKAIEFIRTKRPIAFFGHVNFVSAIEKFYLYNC